METSQPLNKSNIFKEPVPYYLWIIRERRNGGYPFIHFQFSKPVITASDYIKLEKQNEKKVIKKIVSTFNFDGDDIVYTAGEGEEHETLTIENPFMTQEILNDVYKNLDGFEYVPYDMSWRCWPQLEPGDAIIIETRKGETLRTFIMSNKITFRGGLKADTNAPAKSQQQSEFPHKGTLTKKIEHIEKTRIVEGKDYYGVRTSRDFGLKIKREDGKSEMTLNSDKMEFLSNGERKIYFDVQEELYKFTGKILASLIQASEFIGGKIIIINEAETERVILSTSDGFRFQSLDENTGEWEDSIWMEDGKGKFTGEIFGSTITGGIFRTSESGARIEISNNQIRSYDSSGYLTGFATNNTNDNMGDWEFYHLGLLVFKIANQLNGVRLQPVGEGMTGNTTALWVGAYPHPLFLEGPIHINYRTFSPFTSKTAGATYGTTEQQMLQETHDELNRLLNSLAANPMDSIS